MRPSILLFDIDGTLLPTLGVGRRALERAIEEILGHPDALDGVRFEGMTDRPIVRAGFARIGYTPPPGQADALIDRILARYVECLEDELDARRPLPLLPGVMPALDAAATWPETGIGLGTGNVRPGAEAKLRAAAIWDRFAFGAFACDHDDRSTLLGIAAERGAAVLGRPLAECRVVVIGDTPRDVAAAQAIGAESIGVATSRYSTDELAASGATAAFADMTVSGFLGALRG